MPKAKKTDIKMTDTKKTNTDPNELGKTGTANKVEMTSTIRARKKGQVKMTDLAGRKNLLLHQKAEQL